MVLPPNLMVMPVRNVHRLHDEVDLALAAMIEPLSCAIRGYDLLPRRMGEHYLIYGAGTMGLMMASASSPARAGAASVTVVDRNPARLDAAEEVGVTQVALAADDVNRPGGWEVGDRLHRRGAGDRGCPEPSASGRYVPAVRGGTDAR